MMQLRGPISALLALVFLVAAAGASWWIYVANVLPQAEAELLTHKSGLWEFRWRLSDSSEEMNQRCIDIENDHSMFRSSDNMGRFMCSLRRPDSGCTVTTTFDAEDAYALTIASKIDRAPGGNDYETLNARWLGPCKPGQEPGKVIAPNDGKSRIFIELRDRSPKVGAPLPR